MINTDNQFLVNVFVYVSSFVWFCQFRSLHIRVHYGRFVRPTGYIGGCCVYATTV